GPMRRTPLPCAAVKNSAVSATGMPAGMITVSGMPASTASSTAPLACAGGTNTTDTSAPVAAMASATVPNTGTSTPASSKRTLWPALRGFTPPTIVVPAASMRVVCFMPSEPVMPWTMTLEASVRKIAISSVLSSRLEVVSGVRRGVRELGGLVGAAVHGVGEGHERVVRLAQDRAPLGDVVAVEAHHERLGRVVAEDLERLDDAVGDLVARRDA